METKIIEVANYLKKHNFETKFGPKGNPDNICEIQRDFVLRKFEITPEQFSRAFYLYELKQRLGELETTMVETFQEQKDRNREMFQVCRDIEKIQDPEAYEENKAHWEGHEMRF